MAIGGRIPESRSSTRSRSVACAMRLGCLALDKGRLTDDLVTALAVRGALLVDLALRGRLTETADAVAVDPKPSGFAPADKLVAGEAPTLTELLTRGPVDQYDLAAEHLRRGSWTLKRRLLLDATSIIKRSGHGGTSRP